MTIQKIKATIKYQLPANKEKNNSLDQANIINTNIYNKKIILKYKFWQSESQVKKDVKIIIQDPLFSCSTGKTNKDVSFIVFLSNNVSETGKII